MKLAAPRPGMGGHGDPPPERSVGHWRCYGFPQATATIGGRMAACQPRALPVGNRASAVHKATSACPCGRRATAERPNHHRRPRIPKRSIYIANSRGCQIKVPLPGAAVHEFVQLQATLARLPPGEGRGQSSNREINSLIYRCRARPRAANTCQSGDVRCCERPENPCVSAAFSATTSPSGWHVRDSTGGPRTLTAQARLAPTCWRCIHAPKRRAISGLLPAAERLYTHISY
jgi:hypothetical protein